MQGKRSETGVLDLLWKGTDSRGSCLIWTCCLDSPSVGGSGEDRLIGRNQEDNNHSEGSCED